MKKLIVLFALFLLFIGCSSEGEVPTIPDIKEILSPRIEYFFASPPQINVGDTSQLSWSVENATVVSVAQISPAELAGTIEVAPVETTTYTLIARNDTGESSRIVEVVVVPKFNDVELVSLEPAPGSEIRSLKMTVKYFLGDVEDWTWLQTGVWLFVHPVPMTSETRDYFVCEAFLIESLGEGTVTLKITYGSGGASAALQTTELAIGMQPSNGGRTFHSEIFSAVYNWIK